MTVDDRSIAARAMQDVSTIEASFTDPCHSWDWVYETMLELQPVAQTMYDCDNNCSSLCSPILEFKNRIAVNVARDIKTAA